MKKGKHVMMHKPIANRLHEGRLVDRRGPPDEGGHAPAGLWQRDRQRADRRADQAGRHRPAPRDAQLDEPARLAAVHRDPPRQAAGAERTRLGLVAGAGGRPALSSALHAHGIPRLVRFRRRLDGRHGHLQPVARVHGAGPGRARQRRGVGDPHLHDRRLLSRTATNDFSYPTACTIRLQFAARAGMPALDLFWYDGGMKPRLPREVESHQVEMGREGILFVGDDGAILAGFHGQEPQLFAKGQKRAARHRRRRGPGRRARTSQVRLTPSPVDRGHPRRRAVARQLPERRSDHRRGQPGHRRPAGRQEGRVRQRNRAHHQRARREQVPGPRIPERLGAVGAAKISSAAPSAGHARTRMLSYRNSGAMSAPSSQTMVWSSGFDAESLELETSPSMGQRLPLRVLIPGQSRLRPRR